VKRAWVLSCIVGTALVLGGCKKDESRSAAQEPVASASQTPGRANTVPDAQAPSVTAEPARSNTLDGLATVGIAQLPRQAVATLRLIEAGGPFPFEKDGVVFGNRERLLPRQPRGYYHEYTVPTPRARDRGARRIVCGGARRQVAECYYSDDHYASFKRIAD
jgi:ribonuclease T1